VHCKGAARMHDVSLHARGGATRRCSLLIVSAACAVASAAVVAVDKNLTAHKHAAHHLPRLRMGAAGQSTPCGAQGTGASPSLPLLQAPLWSVLPHV
jgi:hypothetical protein